VGGPQNGQPFSRFLRATNAPEVILLPETEGIAEAWGRNGNDIMCGTASARENG
jgi:hypothetical protein